jgi:hypothetical protein
MPDDVFTISIDVPANLAPNLMAAAGRGAQAGIQEGILLLQRVVVQNILQGRDVLNFGPAIFTGNLRDHIVSEMSKTGLSPEGFVGVAPAAELYALTLEEGRTPGSKMPINKDTGKPFEGLINWVTQKLGVSGTDKQIENVAWLVARSIGRKGFPGVHMFRNAVWAQEPNVVALVDLRIQEAVAKEAAK